MLLVVGGALPATAAGIGGYAEFGTGSGDFEYDFSPEFDVDARSAGFGFVFDSNLAGPRIFNYRLNIGYERLELEDDFSTTLDLDGLVIDNTFGFALAGSPTFRWWLGPQVRIGFYNGETDDGFEEVDLAAFGIGAVTGMNFMTGNVCMSVSLGARITGYAGESEALGITTDLEGNTGTVFLNLAMLFGN
jgi:hypothetical protein